MEPPKIESSEITAQIQQIQINPHPWFEKLARFGYVAKGIVYMIVGLLALQTITGAGGKKTGSTGALETIVSQPFGKFLLATIAIGLIGYVMWRFVQAILDPEHTHQKFSWKNTIRRIGYGGSAIAYTGLALTSIKLIVGFGSTDDDSKEDVTLFVLSQPFGRWLVGLAGAIAIAVGIYFFFKAYKAKFRENFQLEQISFSEMIWIIRVGRLGVAARGLIFIIIGFFIIQAAIQLDPSQTKGVGGVLTTLSSQPFGAWIMGCVALGLTAYGIFCLLQARYRKIVHPTNISINI